MLIFKIDNQLIDIGQISFSMVKKSPIFYPEEGSYSLTFNLPFSPKNNKILGFPHRISIYSLINKEFDCQLSFDGCLFVADKLHVTKTSNQGFECFLKLDTGNFNSLTKNISLNEIDYGEDITLGTTSQDVLDHAESVITQQYPAVNYQFPTIYNPLFFGKENEFNLDYDNLLNYYLPTFGFIRNLIYVNPAKDNRQILVPMPYLFNVLNCLFSHFGYSLSGDVMQDEELKTLILANNRSLDEKEKKYFTRAELTSTQFIDGADIVKFDDEVSDLNEDDDNCYTPATGKYEIKSRGYINVFCKIKIHKLETATIKGVIRKETTEIDEIILVDDLLTEHSFTFWVDDADVGSNIYYFAQDSISEADFNVTEAELIITHVSVSDLNIFEKKLNIKNHIPGIKIPAFLTALKLHFGIALFIDPLTFQIRLIFLNSIINSASYIEFSQNILTEPEITPIEHNSHLFGYNWSSLDEFTQENFKDITSYPLLGEFNTFNDLPIPNSLEQIALVKNTNQFYVYTNDQYNIPGWEYLTDDFFDVKIGEGETNKKTNSTTCTMNRYNIYFTMIPQIKQVGSSPIFPTGKNDFPLNLLFYRGMQPNESNNNYPLASPTKLNSLGNSTGNYNLKWNGPGGLYETFWEDFINWYSSSKEVTIQKQLSAKDFLQIDFSKKYRIQEVNYLIKEIEVTITNREIKPAKLTLLAF